MAFSRGIRNHVGADVLDFPPLLRGASAATSAEIGEHDDETRQSSSVRLADIVTKTIAVVSEQPRHRQKGKRL